MTARCLALASALALSACASMSGRRPALEDAQGRYDLARSDPQVSTLAPAELDRAGLALQAARQALADGRAAAQVDHLAYLANQRITIARDEAGSRGAQAVIAALAADRTPTRPCPQAREPGSAGRGSSAAAPGHRPLSD